MKFSLIADLTVLSRGLTVITGKSMIVTAYTVDFCVDLRADFDEICLELSSLLLRDTIVFCQQEWHNLFQILNWFPVIFQDTYID